MTESGNWVSRRVQYVGNILYREGTAFTGPGYDDPTLMPPGSWAWRCNHDRFDGGPDLPFASSARGFAGWAKSRPAAVEPVVADHDFLHGRPIIDERATVALKNAAFERMAEARHRPKESPEALYRRQCKQQGMKCDLPPEGGRNEATTHQGRTAADPSAKAVSDGAAGSLPAAPEEHQ